MDERLLPVPVGVPGELVIAGAGLARSYWGQADLNMRHFIAGSQCRTTLESGYSVRGIWLGIRRTGRSSFWAARILRWSIRGSRFRLDEIETAMTQIEGIRQAAVIVIENPEGGPILIGYAVSEDEKPDAEQLIDRLGEQLPACMLPDQVVFLKSFPLSPTNTLDRRQLPIPELRPKINVHSAEGVRWPSSHLEHRRKKRSPKSGARS